MEKKKFSELTIGDLRKFDKEFRRKGVVRTVDGDKRTIS